MSYKKLEPFLPLLLEAESEIFKSWSLDPEVRAIASMVDLDIADLVGSVAELLFLDITLHIKSQNTLGSSKNLEELVHFSFNKNLKVFQVFKLVTSLQHYMIEAIFFQDTSSVTEVKEALFLLNRLFESKISTLLNLFSDLHYELAHLEHQDTEGLSICKPYQALVDEVCAIVVTDPQGVITFVNDRFCELSQYTKDELLNHNVNIVRHLDTPKAQFADIWNTITDKKVWTGELRNANKLGSAYYVSATIAPVLDSDGDIEELISVQYDITLIKEYERDFKQFYEEQENKRLSRLIDAQGSDLVRTIPLPAFIIDADNIIVEFNDRFSDLFSIENDAEIFKSLSSSTLAFMELLDEKSQKRFEGFTQEWVTLYNTLYCDDPLTATFEVDLETKHYELKLSQFKGIKTLICLVEL